MAYPSLMERFWGPKTKTCRKTNHQSYGPEPGDVFRLNFSVIIFGTASNRKWRFVFTTSAIEAGVWIWVSTYRGRQQALRYAENSSSTKAAAIFQASSRTSAASAWAETLRCNESHVIQGGSENISEALSRTAWCYHPPDVEYLWQLAVQKQPEKLGSW